MIDPKQEPSHDEQDAAELESETLKDLTPPEDQAEGVKGGITTPAYECENATA